MIEGGSRCQSSRGACCRGRRLQPWPRRSWSSRARQALPRPDPGSPAAPDGPVAASDTPADAGKGDSDGDKIADDLEAALADLKPGDRVDVIVQGVSPGRAKKVGAVARGGPHVLDHQGVLRLGDRRSGERTVAHPVGDPGRARTASPVAFDAAGDRDYGVQAARDAGIATDGTLDGSGVGICIIDTGIDPNHEQLSGRIVGWKDWVGDQTTALRRPRPRDARGVDRRR